MSQQPRSIATISALIAALILVGVICGIYISNFGTTRSADPAIWGQFGDYIGGVLNPLFALAAFLSALWSIDLQRRESRAAAEQLAEQTQIAREELAALSSERLGEEFLLVIRDIDQRISALLATNISLPGTSPISITQMVAEADRLESANSEERSLAYEEFLTYANRPGNVVEVPVREIKSLVKKLRVFLGYYSRHKANDFAPVIVYYADKGYQLMNLLEDLGGMAPDTREFFARVSNSHG
ncbi:hypothetical protein [Pseudomonas aeruginosa]|uniref:hypothetical protein n=1 Tax=Pseudomonas aeruginosa TaxID=287 RepID=UPI003CC5CA80